MATKKSTKTDYWKQSEQNVLNHAVFMKDVLRLINNTYAVLSDKLLKDPDNKERFRKGLLLIQEALTLELSKNIMDCVVFTGTGGEDTEAFSRERVKEVFENHPTLVQFMDDTLILPETWKGFVPAKDPQDT